MLRSSALSVASCNSESLKFRRLILPPSSGLKINPSKNQQKCYLQKSQRKREHNT
jgi:hypothetical protein